MFSPMLKFIGIHLFLLACLHQNTDAFQKNPNWDISILPSSIRLDPSTNQIIENRFSAVEDFHPTTNLLTQNWVYDGKQAVLNGARGEYLSFQLVLTRHGSEPLKGITVEMDPFAKDKQAFSIDPELFLEWSVEVKQPSTGYPKASLGPGWYPDALIPFDQIQSDSSKVHRRWVYPLELPDFNNRIDDQKSLIIWVDQYIPFDEQQIAAGTYHSDIKVTIGEHTKSIPIMLNVWNFAIPNENTFRASLQHEGFLSSMDEDDELRIYQLFKRNRIALMDPTYAPKINYSATGAASYDWSAFDQRMAKYFVGQAFTEKHGYKYGPGYGEPIETFILPFNVRGKHGGHGWPDVANVDNERDPDKRILYTEAIQSVRDHLSAKVDPNKTELTVYLNGLDESYFPEAWDRMVYYGDLFRQYYPEAHFRIDGGYSDEAMKVVENSINSWASHTLYYDLDRMKQYQEKGIEDWIYGPMLYESKVNSWVGSSTFIDLPLVNDRAISWASWKYGAYSWISWGIGAGWRNAWYDPETWKDTYKSGSDSDPDYTFKKLNGNGLLIYSPGIIPNVQVACPSIRLKTMRDGVQEIEYLKLLAARDGNDLQARKIVNKIIGKPFGQESIGNLDVWSFDARAWDTARKELGELIDK
jgi:hypothetical protein